MDHKKVINSAINELLGLSIFEGFERDFVEQACAGGTVVFTEHKETLFKFGESAQCFGIVLNGAYKLTRPSKSGEDAIMHFSTVGDVIGAFIMSHKAPCYPVNVIAMGPSRFLKIPREVYIEVWSRQPSIILKIQNILSLRMSQMQHQKSMLKAPLTCKIALLIIDLLHRHEEAEILTLPLPLTRREIADNVGSSVESVIRIMSKWSKEGVLETNDQQIKILNMQKLIELINDR